MKTTLILIFNLLLLATSRAGVLPNDAMVEDKTISEWSVEWWKWLFPIPANQNPMLDTDGSLAAVGQPNGKVFFIAGDLGLIPDIFTRRFTVPEGKYLFFPLLMYVADNVNAVPPLTIGELRDQAAGVAQTMTNLYASIDGVEIPNLYDRRILSPVFNFLHTNTDNLHTIAYGQAITGLIDPMVSDGYWLMIEPLPPGQHVLRFGGRFIDPFFYGNKEVDYITVVPVSLSARVADLISSLTASNLRPGDTHQLLAALRAAAKAFEHNHVQSGLHNLGKFQDRVRHEVARINSTLAEELILAAQQIIDRAERDGNIHGQ